jgi:hypothetical protein
MSEGDSRRNVPLEVESTERWVANKSEEELLVDLKVYLARLRDNPHSLPDRLRVAAIQFRLGRAQEALIHYEGVLRGYVHDGRVMSAIALCQRILTIYPEHPRIQRILAALYARAPHGSTGAPSPVTPIAGPEELPTSSFVVEDPEEEEIGTDLNVVVDRVFPDVPREPVRQVEHYDDHRPTTPYPAQLRSDALDYVPTTPVVDLDEDDIEEATPGAMLLTKKKGTTEELAPADRAVEDDGELVVLLTKKKKR